MVFIGIDPGKQGAIAKIEEGCLLATPVPLSSGEYDVPGMLDLFCGINNKEAFCVIERAQAMPGQGVVSMFEFGKGYGLWLGVLYASLIPFEVVHSRVWTKEMLAGAPGEGKNRGITVAKRLFPLWQPVFKKDLVVADAILLAEYARRRWKGK